jgi:hypothetical protein
MVFAFVAEASLQEPCCFQVEIAEVLKALIGDGRREP